MRKNATTLAMIRIPAMAPMTIPAIAPPLSPILPVERGGIGVEPVEFEELFVSCT